MGSSFLYKGMICAIFSSEGKIPSLKDKLMIYVNGDDKESITGLITFADNSS